MSGNMTEQYVPCDQERAFLAALQQAIQHDGLHKLVLSQYQAPVAVDVNADVAVIDDAQAELQNVQKISVRPILLQGQHALSVLYQYPSQDITKNYSVDAAWQMLLRLMPHCKQMNLWTAEQEIQLKRAKKKVIVTKQKLAAPISNTHKAHDRSKQRFVQQDAAYLQHLGVCDAAGQVIPSMARKWKQINKFIEIFSGALSQISPQQQLRVVDFGSGKGYLTFALYDYLRTQQQAAQVTGVELRAPLVEFCEQVTRDCDFQQLDFFQGDVRSYAPERLDVMIALHACDVATDFAIHTGLRLNASMIMCAPCCHKELRPQLHSPKVLAPMLQFGIHAGQQAEMLTDTLRALWLKAYGYETKVFEFVALEHTSKNKMILATKRKTVTEPDPEIVAQIQALKAMYGIHKQHLELLLHDPNVAQADVGVKC